MSPGDTAFPEAGSGTAPPPAAAAPPPAAAAAARRESRPAPGRWRSRRSWPGPAAAWAAGALAAFGCYLLLARTRAVNSDGAGQALQAWDMLHGNLLLRGWRLSDVSFYTTELPQYMLVELIRGLHANVVHVAAAMTYTLAVLLAALLAKGTATGREALLRVFLAAGIMLAPQLGAGVNILVSSPDHIGTSVPVMVTWLILDRARRHWSVPLLAGLLLGWAAVADPLALYIGVLPLALVSAARAGRAVVADHQPLRAQRYDLALGAAALAGGAASVLALRLIHALGGFYTPPPVTRLAANGTILLHHLRIAGEGLLLLGGADFLHHPLNAGTAILVLHLAGVLLAAWGVWLAVRRFPRDADRVTQLLVSGVLINLAAYVVSTQAGRITSTREIGAVLPLAAALAGRLVAGWLLTARPLGGRLKAAWLLPVLAIVAAGYLAGLGREISRPPAPAQDQQLTSWLAARHLRTGLSGYWEANVVTLASGGQVRIWPVTTSGGRVAQGRWESNTAWYDPRRSRATFVVLFRGVPGYQGFTSARQVLATFGRPARTYRVGAYRVLVWDKNLLTALR